MRVLTVPLLILAALATYAAGLGLAARWRTPFPVEFAVSGALHAAWLLPAARRSGLGLAAVCWTASVWLVQRGIASLYLADSGLPLAILLEGVCLLLALSILPAEPWAGRVARWRRSRADIVTQLRMGQGIVPWWRLCLRQFTHGAAETPVGSDHRRFAAALADAEHRLRIRISRAAMPEQLRQSVLESVSAVVGRAETAAAQRAIELEQLALSAAAACREQCERMESLPASARQALANECEEVFLELTGH